MFIILTFVGFTALVALISWYRTRNDNLDTQEGYFLAGRGLSGLVIAGSLELTNLSTEQLVGQSGQSYATNMGAMNWSVSASFALLCLAMVFLPRYLKAGITTIPAIAPKITLISHVVLYGLSHLLPFIGINVHYLWVLSVLFIVDMLIMVAVGKWKPRDTDFILKDVGAVDLTPWKYAKPACVLCFACMLGVYWLFSPLGLASMI